jgi:aspartate racemase
VGLIGGLGRESTIDYYRRILDGWRAVDPSSAPGIVIDSIDVQRALQLVATDRPALVEYLMASINRLAAAGADFIAITANTPHIAFDDLVARATVPLISIVETCAAEARRLGLQRLVLLGTRFTMEASFYVDVFARQGIEVVRLNEADRTWVHDRYTRELLAGDFRDGTREGFIAIVQRSRTELGIDGVILGGTELPLLLRTPLVAGVPALDTTALHVAAIIAQLRES